MYHKYRFCTATDGKMITFDIVQQRIQTEWYKLRLKLGKDGIHWQEYCKCLLLNQMSVESLKEAPPSPPEDWPQLATHSP